MQQHQLQQHLRLAVAAVGLLAAAQALKLSRLQTGAAVTVTPAKGNRT